MGIPSYYKRLCDKNKDLRRYSKPDEQIDWLWIDFNCMIYHCLAREDAPVYSSEANFDEILRKKWENILIMNIENYLEKVIKKVNPSSGIFVAVDGVVPIAKMKQQRMRRFKSAWEREKEPEKNKTWDKNSITPGTEFMERLCKRISKGRLSRYTNFLFSGSDECGEGEHKIMDAWRRRQIDKSHVQNNALYGLDADLIILSMLNRGYVGNVWLFREELVEGKLARDTFGEEIFVWFDIQALEKTIIPHELDTSLELRKKWLTKYLFAMTSLGNDFLPSSLSLKIREDGHERLILALDSVKQSGYEGLLSFFKNLAHDEAKRVQTYILKKKRLADNIGIETEIGQTNYPLSQILIDEMELIDSNGRLKIDWQDFYFKKYFKDTRKDVLCREYIKGLQWVWNYYTGQDIQEKWTWLYKWHMPPLWKWLVRYLETYGFSQLDISTSTELQPSPLEQLTLVLPIHSQWLIPQKKYRSFHLKSPQYYPNNFSFLTTGRRYFWECEAEIPVPSIKEIREAVDNISDY